MYCRPKKFINAFLLLENHNSFLCMHIIFLLNLTPTSFIIVKTQVENLDLCSIIRSYSCYTYCIKWKFSLRPRDSITIPQLTEKPKKYHTKYCFARYLLRVGENNFVVLCSVHIYVKCNKTCLLPLSDKSIKAFFCHLKYLLVKIINQ